MTLLTTSSIWFNALLLLLPGSVLAMLGVLAVRRFVPLERLRTNNEVAGFKFATVGVIYAVLLAFAVLVVWETLNEAEQTVANEAGAAAALFRLSSGLSPDTAAAVRSAVDAYLDVAITADWAAMEGGRGSREGTEAIAAIYAALMGHEPLTNRGSAVLQESLYQVDQLTDARRGRVVVAEGIVPSVIWFTLFLGAGVTLGFTFFFGTENLVAQMMMTGALSVLVFSSLLVIIALDRPFAGAVRIEPLALQTVHDDLILADPAAAGQ